jgi:hypothetical protein
VYNRARPSLEVVRKQYVVTIMLLL